MYSTIEMLKLKSLQTEISNVGQLKKTKKNKLKKKKTVINVDSSIRTSHTARE